MTIKELRAEKKLSQKAFGEALGISAAAVARYEKDTAKLNEKIVKAVKDAFGVELSAGAAEAPVKKPAAKKPAAPKAPAKKAAEDKPAPKKEEKKEEEKAAEEKPAAAEKPAKKAAPKKAKKVAEDKAASKKEEKKDSAKKPAKAAAKKSEAKPAKPAIYIQSAMGGTITVDDVLSRLDKVDTVYIKVEENKAYWVKGKTNGSIDLW